MKVRNQSPAASLPGLQMTPLIDIVFQLLAFFIMTFQIVEIEGDFNLSMPLATPGAVALQELEIPPMVLRMSADQQGALAAMTLNGRPLDHRQLRREMMELAAARDEGFGPLELEIDADYNLDYRHTMDAVTAAAGYRAGDGDRTVPLVENITFAPSRRPAP